ncbi:MAG: sigma-70 family RNA polymerase sigma factor [Thermoguttaceae bacterium]
MASDQGLASATDKQLACQAQRGCQASFEQLLRRYQTPLLGFLRRQGPAADAEDLLQETFLRAYEKLDAYLPRWAFSTWLFTIARRTSINHHRRARLDAEAAGVENAVASGMEPIDELVIAEDRRRLWDVAGEVLSEEQVTALWLHYVEEMPVGEIGLVLGRSRGSVKTMLFRARQRLMPILGEFDEGGRQGGDANAPGRHGDKATEYVYE